MSVICKLRFTPSLSKVSVMDYVFCSAVYIISEIFGFVESKSIRDATDISVIYYLTETHLVWNSSSTSHVTCAFRIFCYNHINFSTGRIEAEVKCSAQNIRNRVFTKSYTRLEVSIYET